MYDRLEYVILFAKKLWLRVGLKTNAWLLSDERLVRIVKYGLDDLYLSIDWPSEEVHDKIRWKVWSFDKNVDVVVKSKKINPNLRIYVNSVVMSENYKGLPKMVDFGAKYKLDRVSFVFLNDKNRKDIEWINLNRDEFFSFFEKEVVEIFEKSSLYGIPVDFSPFLVRLSWKENSFIISELRNNFDLYRNEIESFYEWDYGKYFYDRYGCFWPLDHCSVNFNWDMYGCCVVERDSENSVWNILNDDLVELWGTERYIDYRKDSNEGCGYAEKCASNFYTRKSLFKEIYLDGDLYSKNNPRNYYRYLKELRYEDSWVVDEIKIRKLKKLLLKFYDNLDFYRSLLEERWIFRREIENVDSLDFVERLPVLDKRILRENSDEIKKLCVWREFLNWKTSGSSGNRLEFVYPLDFRRYIKQIAVFSEEGGFVYGDSYFAVTPINCNQVVVNNLEEPEYVKKVYINVTDFEYRKEIFEDIEKVFRNNMDVKFLHGDSKYLLFIILWFEKFGFELPKLSGISVSYSYTNRSLKEFIEEKFGCEVYDNYGCSEVWPISLDNWRSREIFGDNIIVEEVYGKIVVTDLDNDLFPFVRYRNGDLWKVEWDDVDVYGKELEIIGWRNLRDLDEFFYGKFSDVLFYQFVLGDLYLVWKGKLDLESLEEWVSEFLGEVVKVFVLEGEFFDVGGCSKFRVMN